MTRRWSSSAVSLEALFETGRQLPRQPDAVRQRVLARVAGATRLAQPPSSPAPLPVAGASRQLAMAAAAAALAVGLASTVYALSGAWSPRDSAARAGAVDGPTLRVGEGSPSPRPSGSLAPLPSGAAAGPVAESSAASQEAAPPSHPTRPVRQGDETYDAELPLMRNAHNAYASHEFANALVLVSEHARRFPRGLLAEEREALRVRCLLAAGRVTEAQRAATDFARRFPRSVLVPRIQAEARVTE